MFRKCPSYRAYLISWRDVRMLNSERDGLLHGDNISCEGQSPSQRDACALRENEMARPPKAIKLDRQISIRFTGTELDEIDAQAAAAGTTLSEFGRTRMLAKRNTPARELGMGEALQEERLIHIFAGWEICSISLCGTCIRPGRFCPMWFRYFRSCGPSFRAGGCLDCCSPSQWSQLQMARGIPGTRCQTADQWRVAWTHTLNCAHDDIGSAVHEMLHTYLDRDLLRAHGPRASALVHRSLQARGLQSDAGRDRLVTAGLHPYLRFLRPGHGKTPSSSRRP